MSEFRRTEVEIQNFMKNLKQYRFIRKLSKRTRKILSDHRWFMLEWCHPKYDWEFFKGIEDIKWSDFYKNGEMISLP